MAHRPYIRPVEGANTAVLFVHGIVGTPEHFLPFVPLVPEEWSVYNLLLAGHGGTVSDFAHASMAQWKTQVAAQVEAILSTHDRLFIAAHSMGCLFAIETAIKYPDRVAGLFLMAVPLCVHLPPSTVKASLAAALGRAKPGTAAMAMVEDSSVTLTKNLSAYLSWLPRFAELLAECGRVKGRLPLLTVPTRCFQSEVDELVSRRSEKHLASNSCIDLKTLPDSGHFAYGSGDLALLRQEFREMLKKD